MQFSAKCAAVRSCDVMSSTFRTVCSTVLDFNGCSLFVMRLDPPNDQHSHLTGDLPREVIQLKAGKSYRVTIEEIAEPNPAA